ncbi:HAMP domain-containing sensor histidine kinase [Actinoplanes sp. NPDC089786]|uniref:sensor histidine kinase n=1 Tax=Actinoplanes sp. NPDC089786 TaxID=3155185 RepID=UPI0034404629
MASRGVPVHRSIVVRLLATSILVAICAVVGTAWLAVETTTQAIRQEQGRSLADDQHVYDVLTGFAATHRGWEGVAPVLDGLARRTGQRITLLTADRQPIADTHPGPSPTDRRPTATIDPLVGPDPRAVGPYRLAKDERAIMRKWADGVLGCMRNNGVRGEAVEEPTGQLVVRPRPATVGDVAAESCGGVRFPNLIRTESRALDDLGRRITRCMGADPPITIGPGFVTKEISSPKLDACVMSARRAQLRPYVAPPALLYVGDPVAPGEPEVFSLSGDNVGRIAWVTGVVLALTVAFTVVAGLRLVRPLRALAAAAGAREPMPVARRDEIGHLSMVLNDLSERRDRSEQQRKAMISDIAHELRSPMTNIRSWLEAAEDGVTPTDGQLLALLLDETSQLSRILDDLRDLAAADAGTLRIHPEPFRLGDVLGVAADAHRGTAEAGRVRLTTSFDPREPVVADPVRMRQVVGNLLSNAVRHTPPGGTVALRAGVTGPALLIEVSDTGTGIAPDDLPHIFDRFWRADRSRGRNTGGSGLGLAIVRDLAEAHGGTVEAVSALDAGTTVTVRVPARPLSGTS